MPIDGGVMGLFKRRNRELQGSERIQWVTATARALLAERGVETTIAQGAISEDVALLAIDGAEYPLFNALAKTEGRTADDARQIITEHIDNLLTLQSTPGPGELSAEQLRRQIRTRLLVNGGGVNDPSLQYARPFCENLVLALCIDYPQTVAFVTDSELPGLALDIEELYAFGQSNTDREPLEQRFEAASGVQVLIGDSPFTASKAANLSAVLGPAPFGTLFTLPHRHMLIALPITGPEPLSAVSQLYDVMKQVLEGGLAPGGALSTDILFSWHDVVSRVSAADETGTVSMMADERL